MRVDVFASRMTEALEVADTDEPIADVPGAPLLETTDLRESSEADVDVEIFLVLEPNSFPSGLFAG